MSLFRLGIIGGCLSHQRGIPLGQLYHRQLARLLKSRDEINLKIFIARAFGLNPVGRLDELLGRNAVDGILFHLRNNFVRKAGLLAAYDRDGVRHRVLHPFIFRRGQHGAWEDLEVRQFDAAAPVIRQMAEPQDEHDAASPGRLVGGIRIRDINYVLGKIAGLHSWAINDELLLLNHFLHACRARDVPVFVMGPTPMAASPMKNRLCERMNKSLELHTIPFCALDKLTESDVPVQTADGWHMTAEGHRAIAKKLYAPVSGWIKNIRTG